ncbi:hypothetical protein [Wolbachia endosymbiont of Nasonia oneida]
MLKKFMDSSIKHWNDIVECHANSPFDVIPVLDTGIQTLIVILVNNSGKNKCSSQMQYFC